VKGKVANAKRREREGKGVLFLFLENLGRRLAEMGKYSSLSSMFVLRYPLSFLFPWIRERGRFVSG